jgi:hypothetical protein
MMRVSHFAVFILLFLLIPACNWAQRVDVALTGGIPFVSVTKVTFAVPCSLPPSSCPPTAFSDNLKSTHSYFAGGSIAIRVLDRKTYALHVEVPAAAGVYSQILTLPTTPAFVSEMSSIFVTPSLRAKLLPDSAVSPWASAGGGWARYSPDPGVITNKGALQLGGGLDFKIGVQRLRLRAEVRDFLTGAPEAALVSGPFVGKPAGGFNRHNVFLGGGVLFRF